MSMKRLAIIAAVSSHHNNFSNTTYSYFNIEKGGHRGLQTMRPGAHLHGNVNVMLGGAMLSVVITVVCFVCYCCHRNIKKRSNSIYRQRWIDNEANMEIYSVEQQCFEATGLFIGTSDTNNIVHHSNQPPPSYDSVVALDEMSAAAAAAAATTAHGTNAMNAINICNGLVIDNATDVVDAENKIIPNSNQRHTDGRALTCFCLDNISNVKCLASSLNNSKCLHQINVGPTGRREKYLTNSTNCSEMQMQSMPELLCTTFGAANNVVQQRRANDVGNSDGVGNGNSDNDHDHANGNDNNNDDHLNGNVFDCNKSFVQQKHCLACGKLVVFVLSNLHESTTVARASNNRSHLNDTNDAKRANGNCGCNGDLCGGQNAVIDCEAGNNHNHYNNNNDDDDVENDEQQQSCHHYHCDHAHSMVTGVSQLEQQPTNYHSPPLAGCSSSSSSSSSSNSRRTDAATINAATINAATITNNNITGGNRFIGNMSHWQSTNTNTNTNNNHNNYKNNLALDDESNGNDVVLINENYVQSPSLSLSQRRATQLLTNCCNKDTTESGAYNNSSAREQTDFADTYDPQEANHIDLEGFHENGIIRIDMSQIIDRTGLPTYEAALKLESSGYV